MDGKGTVRPEGDEEEEEVVMTDWEQRARETFGGDDWTCRDRALQLAREMADARAEEIAGWLRLLHHSRPELEGDREQYALLTAAKDIERRYCKKPKTREQVLEEALREIDGLVEVPYPSPQCCLEEYRQAGWEACRGVARRALEWKP